MSTVSYSRAGVSARLEQGDGYDSSASTHSLASHTSSSSSRSFATVSTFRLPPSQPYIYQEGELENRYQCIFASTRTRIACTTNLYHIEYGIKSLSFIANMQ